MKLRNKKTGAIAEVSSIGLVWNMYGMPYDLGRYNSLFELNENWEDVRKVIVDGVEYNSYEDYLKSKEPLIKDEEIREAVRTWADTYKIVAVRHIVLSFDKTKHSVIETGYGSDYSAITLETELDLTDGKTYTITELCGEEEE